MPYDPNQPRVPAGKSGGGQWTDTAAGAARAAAGLPAEKTKPKFMGAKDRDYYERRLLTVARNPDGSPKLPRDDPDYGKLVTLDWWKKNCPDHTDFDEYSRQVEDTLKEQIEQCDVVMRIDEEGLESALEDGQFKNTFMVNTSGAAYVQNGGSLSFYREGRRLCEMESLGIPDETPPKNRPVYGILAQDLASVNENAEHYGEITVVFDRDAIGSSSTFVIGDSMDQRGSVWSSSLDDPSFLSHPGLFDKMASGDILDSISEGPDFGDLYWEVQIFDRSTKNIAMVVFDDYPSDSITDMLDSRGIKWILREEM